MAFGAEFRRGGIAALLVACAAMFAGAAGPVNVTTFHYDNDRTGYNPSETILTAGNVASSSFGILTTESVDGSVDTQPLIANNVTIGGSTHSVVYIVTENNSVYAFDADTGQLIIKNNFGPAVPGSALPLNFILGIQSTPVLDLPANVMYVMAFTYDNNTTPTYRIHKISLSTLQDVVAPAVVSPSNRLTDGSPANFVASMYRQRPGLLEANGNIYAGFGSFGDVDDTARGWLLGWHTVSLQPLTASVLTNRHTTVSAGCSFKPPCFLSTIWMSGYGLAADAAGHIMFATGNTARGSYREHADYSESAVEMSRDLTKVIQLFTPWNVQQLDIDDDDLGSGGLMILPPQPGSVPRLAVAAGKSGVLYLLNRDQLGGHVEQAPDRAVGEYNMGKCWCGPSYFVGADGAGRVVTSGGDTVMVWKLLTARATRLTLESLSPQLPSGQDSGFFTSVSSNGTVPGSAVIWAVTRPQSVGSGTSLVALAGSNSQVLYTTPVGWLTDVGTDASIFPVVANGKVYLAAGHHFSILGLGASGQVTVPVDARDLAGPPRVPDHEVYGHVTKVDGSMFDLRTRTGKILHVDGSDAIRKHRSVTIIQGEAVVADGSYSGPNTLRARLVFRAKNSPLLWYADK